MRNSQYKKLNDIFIQRWSPRAFSSKQVSDEDLLTCFEAARWAPSCFNEQPHIFVYAKQEEKLKKFQDILNESNRIWAQSAPVLVVVFAKKHFERNEKFNRWAEFDSGSAFMSFVLQAHMLGLVCHGMGGFDEEKSYEVCQVDPKKYQAMCVFAVGYQGEKEQLPPQLQEKESPNGRQELAKIVSENT
ncbi:MAG: nitroreductase family protein [Deltaproteobacteria bacterium]|nr:nitroreductase family protein [Deltaproteobacteria bacterium]